MIRSRVKGKEVKHTNLLERKEGIERRGEILGKGKERAIDEETYGFGKEVKHMTFIGKRK